MTNKIENSIGKTKEIIKKIIKRKNCTSSIYLEGPSGIGKSELVKQIAKELGFILIDIRLGTKDVIDLNGIGIPDKEELTTLWTRPEFFPKDDGKKYLFFLDEFNHTTPQVFGAAYQLVLEKIVGTHKLPKNSLIIGAGNSMSDKGIAFVMPSPLVNRFTKLNVKSQIEDFLKYGESINLDWRIMGFLKSNPDFLHNFDIKRQEDNFPTPRNWESLNDYQEDFDDRDFMEIILNGLFGYTVSISFLSYLEYIKKLPDLEKILKGEVKEEILELNDLQNSMSFYMLIKNYLKNNVDKINSVSINNLLLFISNQKNEELMNLLRIEIISFINKELEEDEKESILFSLHHNLKNYENNDFIKDFKNFTKSIS